MVVGLILWNSLEFSLLFSFFSLSRNGRLDPASGLPDFSLSFFLLLPMSTPAEVACARSYRDPSHTSPPLTLLSSPKSHFLLFSLLGLPQSSVLQHITPQISASLDFLLWLTALLHSFHSSSLATLAVA